MSIIAPVYEFVLDRLETDWIEWITEHSLDVSFVVPRLPHEVVFAMGGWLNSSACNLMEIYDNRADRWTQLHQFDDQLGRRAYHRAIAIESKLVYYIGGYCNNEYYNKCVVLDLSTKTWKEVLEQ